MKRTLSLFLALVMCLSLFGLSACSDKVESERHFGYKIEYIKENFPFDSIKEVSCLIPYDSLEFKFETTDSIGIYPPDDSISSYPSFEFKAKDVEYCDTIRIYAYTFEEAKEYLKVLNHEFDLLDADDKELNSLLPDVDDVVIDGVIIDTWQYEYRAGISLSK